MTQKCISVHYLNLDHFTHQAQLVPNEERVERPGLKGPARPPHAGVKRSKADEQLGSNWRKTHPELKKVRNAALSHKRLLS